MIRARLRLWLKKASGRPSQLFRPLSAIGRGSLNSRTLRTLGFKRCVFNTLRTSHFLKRYFRNNYLPNILFGNTQKKNTSPLHNERLTSG